MALSVATLPLAAAACSTSGRKGSDVLARPQRVRIKIVEGLFRRSLVAACSVASDVGRAATRLPLDDVVSMDGVLADDEIFFDESSALTSVEKEICVGIPGETKRRRRARLAREILENGVSPIDLLERSEREEGWRPDVFWSVLNILATSGRTADVVLVFRWWQQQATYSHRELHYVRMIRMCGCARMVDEGQKFFDEMVRVGIRPTVNTYTGLLQIYAEAGLFDQAKRIFKTMLEAGLKPNVITYTGLIQAYGKHGRYNEMAKVFNDLKTYQSSQPSCIPVALTYSVLIQSYAKGGLFRRMEKAFQEMLSKGLAPDGHCVNALVQGYADAGALKDMERCYCLIKYYRVGIKLETIRSMAMAYIRRSYFYQLGGFARHVGQNRLQLGCLLENLLLLSHAANFQMRELEKEYVELKERGFHGDVTTFNIRALAFSKMKMFSDLRVTLIEMQQDGIEPDMVTYGAVMDAYARAEILESVPDIMLEMRNLDTLADIRTDALVFDAFGKGDFHLCSENLASELLGEARKHLTYSNLIGYYLKRSEINESERS